MSRLAKKPLQVPDKVTVTVAGTRVTAKGPAGEISRDFRPEIAITLADNALSLTPDGNSIQTRALWGTTASHLKNMLAGAAKPFVKKLIVEGIGFKSEVKGKDLVMSLGFSHLVKVAIPAGLTVTAEKNMITISGVDKENVGQFAAIVRDLKRPEPYKGKGIRYDTEVVRRKEGKKTV